MPSSHISVVVSNLGLSASKLGTDVITDVGTPADLVVEAV